MRAEPFLRKLFCANVGSSSHENHQLDAGRARRGRHWYMLIYSNAAQVSHEMLFVRHQGFARWRSHRVLHRGAIGKSQLGNPVETLGSVWKVQRVGSVSEDVILALPQQSGQFRCQMRVILAPVSAQRFGGPVRFLFESSHADYHAQSLQGESPQYIQT